jgi:hypothetical protein
MQIPVQQWHAKVRLQGAWDSYTLRLRLPDLDDLPDPDDRPGHDGEPAPAGTAPAATGEHLVTSTRRRAPLTGSARLILAARFGSTLTGGGGAAAPVGEGHRRADRVATTQVSGAKTFVTSIHAWAFSACRTRALEARPSC